MNSSKDEEIEDAGSTKKFECSDCEFTSFYHSSFKRHLAGHRANNAVHCIHCSFSSGYGKVMLKHVESCHRSLFEGHSGSGPKLAQFESNVRSAEKQASDGGQYSSSLQCQHCSQVFSRQTDLTHHIQQVHNASSEWSECKLADDIQASIAIVQQCRYCSFNSKSKGVVKKHEWRVHIDIRRVQCKLCPWRCNDSPNMQTHLKERHKCLDSTQFTVLSESDAAGTIGEYKHGFSWIDELLDQEKPGQTPEEVGRKPCHSTASNSAQAERCDSASEVKQAKKLGVKKPKSEPLGFSAMRLTKGSSDTSSHAVLSKNKLLSGKHKQDEGFKCEVCLRVFACESLVRKHFVIHTDLRRYRCNVCGWRSNFYTSMKKHVLKMHNSEKSFDLLSVAEATCSIKSYKLRLSKTASLDSKKAYSTCKSKVPERCDEASASFKINESVDNEKLILVDNSERVACEVVTTESAPSSHRDVKKLKTQLNCKSRPSSEIDCGKAGTTSLYKCETCLKTFDTDGALNKHLMQHFDFRCYQCSACGLRSNFRENISRHVKKLHARQATIKQLSFNDAKSTIESYKKRRGEKKIAPAMVKTLNVSATYSVSRKYKKIRQVSGVTTTECKICGLKLTSTHSLKRHANIHSDLRRFQCTICGRRTNSKANLRKHLQTIHGEVFSDSSYCHLSVAEAAESIHLYKSTFPQRSGATKRFKKLCLGLQTQNPEMQMDGKMLGLGVNSSIRSSNSFAKIVRSISVSKAASVGNVKTKTHKNLGSGTKKVKTGVLKKNLKPLKCDLCSFQTWYYHSLIRHKNKLHENAINVTLACFAERAPVTELSFDESISKDSASSQMLTDELHSRQSKANRSESSQALVNFRPYMCSYCQYRTKYPSLLIRHLRACHSSAKLLKLSIDESERRFAECQKISPSIPKPVSNPATFPQPEIELNVPQVQSDVFTSAACFDSQMRRKPMHRCSSCTYQSAWKVNVVKHIKRLHVEASVLTVFDSNSPRKSTVLLARKKRPKSVTRMSVGSLEMKNGKDPLRLRRFYCVLCYYRSNSKYCVNKHFKKHHPDATVNIAIMSVKEARKSLQTYLGTHKDNRCDVVRYISRQKAPCSSPLQTVRSEMESLSQGLKVEKAEEHDVGVGNPDTEASKDVGTPDKCIEAAKLNLASLRKRGLLSPRIPIVPICTEYVQWDSVSSCMIRQPTDLKSTEGDRSINRSSRQPSVQRQLAEEDMHIVYKCSDCDFQSKSRTSAYKHRVKHSHKSKLIRLYIPRVTTECNSDSMQESSLARGSCSIKPLSKVDAHRQGRLSFHSSLRRYLGKPAPHVFHCPLCPFGTNWSESLKRHIAKLHAEDKPSATWIEPKRDEKSAKIASLSPAAPLADCERGRDNQNAIGNLTLNRVDRKFFRRFKCTLCPVRKNSKANVLNHIKVVHRGMGGTVKVLSVEYAKKTLTEYYKLYGRSYNLFTGSGAIQSPKSAVMPWRLPDADKAVPESSSKSNMKCPISSCDQRNKSVDVNTCTEKDSSFAQCNLYACDQCPFVSNSYHALNAHKRNHQRKNPGQYKCKLCNYYCSRLNFLAKHKLVHTPGYNKTNNKTTLMVNAPMPVDVLECDQCPFLTKSMSASLAHRLMHQPRTSALSACERCQFWTDSKKLLRKHVAVHNPGYAQRRLQRLSTNALTADGKLKIADPSKLPGPSSSFLAKSVSDDEAARPLQALSTTVEADKVTLKQKLIVSRFRNSASLNSSGRLPLSSAEPEQASVDNAWTSLGSVNDSCVDEYAVGRHETTAVSTSVAESDSAVGSGAGSKISKQVWRCDKCPYAVVDIHRLRNHVSMHGRALRYHCKYCNYSSLSYWCLSNHCRLHSRQNQNLLNSQSFSNLILLPSRVNQLAPRELSSLPNEAGILDDDNDDDDTCDISVTLNWFRCSRCPFVAGQLLEFFAHMRCHVLGSGVICPFCDFKTVISSQLSSHVKSHFNLPGSEWNALPPHSRDCMPWTSIIAEIEEYVQKLFKKQCGQIEVKNVIGVKHCATVSDVNMNLLYEDHTHDASTSMDTALKTQFEGVPDTCPSTCDLSRVKCEVLSLDNVVQSEGSNFAIPRKIFSYESGIAPINYCQYCDRLFDSSDLLAQHEARHLIGNRLQASPVQPLHRLQSNAGD